MKNWILILSLTSVAFLAACSSMAVDDTVSESFPSDFETSEYALVNPDLAIHQVSNKIKEYNDSIRLNFVDSLGNPYSTTAGKQAFLVDSAADVAAFLADSVVFRAVFDFVGFDASEWRGYDSTLAYEVFKDPTVVDDKATMVRKFVIAIVPFNSLGKIVTEDWQSVVEKSTEIDSALIRMHYPLYGALEGRPYRFCVAGEDANELRDSTQAVWINEGTTTAVPDFHAHHYCKGQDGDLVYLIED